MIGLLPDAGKDCACTFDNTFDKERASSRVEIHADLVAVIRYRRGSLVRPCNTRAKLVIEIADESSRRASKSMEIKVRI